MFISIQEIIDIALMTFAVGYIFSGFFKKQPAEDYDPLTYYKKNSVWEDIKYSAMIAAPAIVLHELSHKFVAMGFGATATLHAPYYMYAFVIFLKLINFPLLFFVGGYVSHTPLAALPSALVSISGPLINLVIWLLCILLIKNRLINRKHYRIAGLIGKLNMFLFIFNVLPVPGFDGFNFFASLIQLI